MLKKLLFATVLIPLAILCEECLGGEQTPPWPDFSSRDEFPYCRCAPEVGCTPVCKG